MCFIACFAQTLDAFLQFPLSARRCIRSANVESGHRQMMAYFGGGCAADADQPALDAFMESSGFESELQALEAAQAHAASLQAAQRPQRVAYELRPPAAIPRRATCAIRARIRCCHLSSFERQYVLVSCDRQCRATLDFLLHLPLSYHLPSLAL